MRPSQIAAVLLLLFAQLASLGSATNNATEPSICVVCACDVARFQIDCTNRTLDATFGDAQWNATEVRAVAAQTLRFDSNAIRNLTAFPALPAVRVLSLRDNRIERIAANAFRQLDVLEELDLSGNRLTYQTLRPDLFVGKYDPLTYEPLKHLKVGRLPLNHLPLA